MFYIILDPCLSNPCKNGGTCNSSSGGFTCSCASGYTGDECSVTSSSELKTSAFQEESPQTSVEYSSQLFQQHSVVTTQAQQQRSIESSVEIQIASQQTSESQQAAKLSLLELLSSVAQQHTTMTAQTYLSQHHQSVTQISLPSLQTLKTTHLQQQQSVVTSLHSPVPLQPSYQPSSSYPSAQSQQETRQLSASQQISKLVSVEVSSQSKQQGLSQQTHVMNGSSISPGTEYIYWDPL